jgi:hypothetical protein
MRIKTFNMETKIIIHEYATPTVKIKKFFNKATRKQDMREEPDFKYRYLFELRLRDGNFKSETRKTMKGILSLLVDYVNGLPSVSTEVGNINTVVSERRYEIRNHTLPETQTATK